MCGICGISTANREGVQKMVQALAHRGPDGMGIEVLNNYSFGHARLAILDPSERSNQPMYGPHNATLLVFNGEIYNFKELIIEHSLQCSTTSDSEVLLLLYQKFGIAMVERLRGMFAFALLDVHTDTLYLVRDSSGIKPLFYTVQNSVLYFASETRALLTALPSKPSINTQALSLYMDHRYVPRPYTLYENVFSVDSGMILTWKNAMLSSKRFTAHSVVHSSAVHDVLQNSVHAHMVSDKPVGVFLSGGLDSTICLHHMSEVSNSTPTTFTIRFDVAANEQPEKFNADAEIAKNTAALYESNHHEVVLDAQSCLRAYSDVAFFIDQPNANTTSVVQYVLAKYAKNYVDVVLTGIGGDELFCGYHHYRYAYIKYLARFMPTGMLDTFSKKVLHVSDHWFALNEAEFLQRVRLTQWGSNINTLFAHDWYNSTASAQYITERFDAVNAQNFVRRIMEYDQYGWLIDEALRLTDASTMAAGIEARTPFIDPQVIAYAQTLPLHRLASVLHSKKFLRNAYTNILPSQVVHAPKSGFFSPFAKWLRGTCKPLLDETVESEYLAPYFSQETMRNIARQHHTGEKYALSELTTLIQLHFWLKNQ